jgi:hypothetical protein
MPSNLQKRTIRFALTLNTTKTDKALRGFRITTGVTKSARAANRRNVKKAKGRFLAVALESSLPEFAFDLSTRIANPFAGSLTTLIDDKRNVQPVGMRIIRKSRASGGSGQNGRHDGNTRATTDAGDRALPSAT